MLFLLVSSSRRYTDKVDVSRQMYGGYFSMYQSSGKSSVMKKEISDMISFITGLYVASNYVKGEKLSQSVDAEVCFGFSVPSI